MAMNQSKYSKYLASATVATLVASVASPVAPMAAPIEAPAVTPTATPVVTATPQAKNVVDFTDTKGNVHESAINALVAANVISGYPDGTFRPSQKLTRSDVVKLLGKWLVTEGYDIPADAVSKPRFTDLTTRTNKELLEYAAVVKDNGIFIGSDGRLLGGDNITRQNMAVVLVRAMDSVKDVDLAEYVAEQQGFKKDTQDISTGKVEVRAAIDVLSYFNITTLGADNFDPIEFTTRGQFATLFYRAINIDFATVAGTPAVGEINAVNNTTIEVTFEGLVGDLDSLNFAIGGLTITNVTLKEDGKTVVLTTTEQKDGEEYKVVLNGKDQQTVDANPNPNPDVSSPDGSNPDGSKPDVSNPDGSKPDGSNPDGSNPDGSKPDSSNPGGSGSGDSGSGDSGSGGSGSGGSGSGGSGSGGSGSGGSGSGGSGSGGSGSDGSGSGGSGSDGSGSGGSGSNPPPVTPPVTPPVAPPVTPTPPPTTNPNPGGTLSPKDAAELISKAKTAAEVQDVLKDAILHPPFSNLNAAQQKDMADIILGVVPPVGGLSEWGLADYYKIGYALQEKNAINAVKSASDADLGAALNNVPGLNLGAYNAMTPAEKQGVHTQLKAGQYNSVADLQKVLNDAKEGILAPILAQINSATDGNTLQSILETNKDALQLDTSDYDGLSAADKTKVADALLANKPYTAESLRTSFVKEVNLLIGHVAPIHAAESIKFVNDERARLGLYAYVHDSELSRIAQIKAEDMAKLGYFDHDSPTYGSPGNMLTHFNYYWSRHGENLHWGSATARGAVDAWINSPGHYANIKHEKFTNIGAGYALDANGKPYWVHMFATQ